MSIINLNSIILKRSSTISTNSTNSNRSSTISTNSIISTNSTISKELPESLKLPQIKKTNRKYFDEKKNDINININITDDNYCLEMINIVDYINNEDDYNDNNDNNNEKNEENVINDINNNNELDINKNKKKYDNSHLFDLNNVINEMTSVNIPFFDEKLKKINLLLPGGGLMCFYQYGALKLLKKFIDNGSIEINKIYCASGGSVVGALFLSGIDINEVSNFYNENKKNKNNKSLINILYDTLNDILPENCHELCTDKLFIYVSEYNPPFSFYSHIISKFESKEHLINMIAASSSIPFFTSDGFYKYKNKYYYDGLDINFDDIEYSPETKNVIIDIEDIEHRLDKKYSFVDDHFEILMLRGIIDMHGFLFDPEYNAVRVTTIDHHLEYPKINFIKQLFKVISFWLFR